LSETLAMPAALAVGGHGRKGSYRLKACEADRWGCTCALFLCPCLYKQIPDK